MPFISHSPYVRPPIAPCQSPVCSVRAPSVPGYRDTFRTAPPPHRTNVKPDSFGSHLQPVALMSLLTGLFKSFFDQLQSLLSSDINPPAPRRDDLPLPRVLPEPEPAVIDKQKQPIPGLPSQRNGVKPHNIWDGFSQGEPGNCVTVSAIKAAMAKFGQSPTDIYRSVEKISEGYRVVMRDGFTLVLKPSELDQAIRGSDFVLLNDRDMLKDAHFLFACSAKRAQMENNDGWASRSFGAAIHSLNNGEDEWGPGEGLKRLGLANHMVNVSVSDFADRSLIGIFNRRGHSVAVVDGSEELYGKRGDRPERKGRAVALI